MLNIDHMEKSPLQPSPGYVILQPDESNTTNISNFVVADSAKQTESSRIARVLAVGTTQTTEYGAVLEPPCQPGDLVVHRQWSNDVIKYDKKTYKYVNFKDIAAVIKE